MFKSIKTNQKIIKKIQKLEVELTTNTAIFTELSLEESMLIAGGGSVMIERHIILQ